MKNQIENFKLLIIILLSNKIYAEIIPIHIGSPNHRHFVRTTTPNKNEDNLRASGLIPITRNQFDLNQLTLIPETPVNQNFEYSKRIGVPAKRSTYLPQANSNYYENEKQKIFNNEEKANYQPANNNYQQSSPAVHQPRNYGYIPSNANNYDYHRTNQFNDYLKNNPSYNNQYSNNNQYEQQQQQYNQPKENHPEYQQNNQQSNDPLDKELNDIGGLDNSFYDMPFNQDLDNNGQLFNDAMNFDMPNFY